MSDSDGNGRFPGTVEESAEYDSVNLYETDGHQSVADEAIRAFYQVLDELSLWGSDFCLSGAGSTGCDSDVVAGEDFGRSS